MSLQQTINQGKPSAQQLTRARILLVADDQWKDVEIAEALKIRSSTVQRIRQRYCQQGLEAALQEKPRPGAPPKVDSRLGDGDAGYRASAGSVAGGWTGSSHSAVGAAGSGAVGGSDAGAGIDRASGHLRSAKALLHK